MASLHSGSSLTRSEIIFTQQPDKPGMQAFYADIKRRMANFGRQPESCAVLPAIAVIVGNSVPDGRSLPVQVCGSHPSRRG